MFDGKEVIFIQIIDITPNMLIEKSLLVQKYERIILNKSMQIHDQDKSIEALNRSIMKASTEE